jgi:hypothetical protein
VEQKKNGKPPFPETEFNLSILRKWLKITKVANLLRQQINYKNYHFIAQVNISKY